MNSIRASVLQFVFVKPTGSAIKLYLFLHEDYSLRPLIIVLITIVNNFSVSCALYGLVLFYHAAHELLLPFTPFAKFLSVKAVVFFSFWQGVVLSIAVRIGVLRDVEGFTANEQATGLQDFLICLEMAAAAIAHYYVFSYTEYQAPSSQDASTNRRTNHPLLHVVDIRDVLSDAKDRLYGGVGFGSELRDKEPIVPGIDNILGDDSPVMPRYSQPKEREARGVSADLLSPPWRFARPHPPVSPRSSVKSSSAGDSAKETVDA